MGIFKVIVMALFPNTCISCGDIIPEGEDLCEYCSEMAETVDFTKVCARCGLPKKECLCSKRVFHFSAAAAPFYNIGVMKKAMYAFKFGHREYIAKYFAKRMALTVRSCYSNVNFDLVTFVPMRFSKKLKRGFNQSELLAKHISRLLKLPLCSNAILNAGKAKVQHTLKIDQRFKNVKGKYKANKNINLNGKTVLLVDDIKTTGATLDECAKQLLLLGADEVYCITGLTTAKNKKKEGK